jgi:hypothetical protein
MKTLRTLITAFCFSIIYLISSCGKPTEFVSHYKIISETPCPGYAQSISIGNVNNKSYAFVAAGQAGMITYNIDNPESTFIIAQWMDTLNSCWAVATYGNKELEIINIADFDSMYFVGGFVWPVAYAYDIFVPDTNFAYIAAKQQFIITDIQDPSFPSVLDQRHFPSDVRGVFIKDSLAYLACEQLGIYITNIKTAPYNIVGNCDTPSNARGLFVADNTCYVADGRQGIVIIDITDPAASSIIGQLDLSGYANRVYVKDTLAYVACGDAGLKVVNVKDRSNPVLIETIQTSYAKGIYAPAGQYIYIADRDQGLIVIKQEE